MTILVARTAGPEEFGRVAVAIAIGTFGAALIDFGSNSMWMRDFAISPEHALEMYRRLTTKVLLCGLIAVLWLILCRLTGRIEFETAGLVAFTVLTSQTMVVPLRARMRADITATSLLFDRLVAFALTLALLRISSSAIILIFASSIGNIAGAILAWQVGVRHVLHARLKWRVQNPWARSKYYGITSASTQAQVLDVPLIAGLSSAAETGLYGAVNRWVMPMALLAGAFSQAVLPIAAIHPSIRTAWLAIRRSSLLLLGALVLDVVVFVFADPITNLLLGKEFEGSSDILRLLAIATAIASFNQPASVVLQAQGHDRLISWLLPLAISLQLALILLFVPRFGALGAGLALVAAQVALACMLGASIWRLREPSTS